MADAIIYCSKCGHTYRYAKELSKRLNLPLFTIQQAKKKLKVNTSIIYISWVCENQLVGYSRILKYDLSLIIAVGIMPFDEDMLQKLKEESQLPSHVVYLRGGISKHKLSLRKRLVLRTIRKNLEFKKIDSGLSEKEEEVLLAIQKDLDFTDFNSLEIIEKYFISSEDSYIS